MLTFNTLQEIPDYIDKNISNDSFVNHLKNGVWQNISQSEFVTNIYKLSSSSSLGISPFEKQMKGSAFSVSRVTGEIIGEVIPTLMAKSTRVINPGSVKNSFKAVADFGNQFQIIEVQEFRVGNLKPFVSSSMGGAGIVTGICK